MNELSKLELISDNYTSNILKPNETIGINKDGDLQSFYGYQTANYNASSAVACGLSFFEAPQAWMIGEDGYAYTYDASLDTYRVFDFLTETVYKKIKDYDYDIIEISTSGQITDEFNCP